MDFDLRDWLLILGPVFVSGVLLHGYWRMRRGRNELRMSLDKSFVNSEREIVDELTFLKAELPNGGARVTRAPTQAPLDLQTEEESETRSASTADAQIPDSRTPQAGTPHVGKREVPTTDLQQLDLDKDVPVLMEPVDVQVTGDPERHEGNDAPVVEVANEPSPVNEGVEATRAPPAVKQVDKPEKFVVVNVLSESHFDGQTLLESLLELGMTFGEMDIFHCLSDAGETEFSAVNAVEPGTFDPKFMATLQTPGVTFFMRVHEVRDPVASYDRMVAAAQKLSHDLGGELLDELRNTMTTQTIEHCRQGIQDFQYKHSA